MSEAPEEGGLKLEIDGPTVLIVDPLSPMRLSIREILTSSGFFIIGEAEDSQQAVALVKKIKPDLVILSARLKDKSGLAVLQLLRGIYPDLKAILLTTDTSDVLSAAQSGETHMLAKPVNRVRLVELANELTSSDGQSGDKEKE